MTQAIPPRESSRSRTYLPKTCGYKGGRDSTRNHRSNVGRDLTYTVRSNDARADEPAGEREGSRSSIRRVRSARPRLELLARSGDRGAPRRHLFAARVPGCGERG